MSELAGPLIEYDSSTQSLKLDGKVVGNYLPMASLQRRFNGGAIVLASGPSAADFPFDLAKNLPLITMNGSVAMADTHGIRPLVYLCDDPSFIEGRPKLAQRGAELAEYLVMSRPSLTALERNFPGILTGRKIAVIERVNRLQGAQRLSDKRYTWSVRNDPELITRFSWFRSKTNRIGFSCNLGKGYFVSRTVPFAALQLGYHMGFQQMFMVGVDLDSAAGRFYEKGKQALPTTLDEDFDDYILPSFQLLAEEVVRPGKFEVYNLSRASRLPDDVIAKLSIEKFQHMLRL